MENILVTFAFALAATNAQADWVKIDSTAQDPSSRLMPAAGSTEAALVAAACAP